MDGAMEEVKQKMFKKAQKGKGVHSCLSFRMKPLLPKAEASGCDAGDVERQPCSHRFLAGFNFHTEILHLCRVYSGTTREQITAQSSRRSKDSDNLVTMSSFIIAWFNRLSLLTHIHT